MIRKLKSITNKVYPYTLVFIIFCMWLMVSELGIVPKFMLPSPLQVLRVFFSEADTLAGHAVVSLGEAFLGLGISTLFAFAAAVMMDRYKLLYETVYPLFVISQTIPVIAIAPLLVLWMGYGISPKIFLIFLVCFFPVVVALLDGFKSADYDAIRLLKSMGASERQILYHIKVPYAIPNFFAGFKVSVSYSVIGAVISEWLGGDKGLGVYMTRVRKSYSFDKMFAVILLVSVISLLLMRLVTYFEKKVAPWNYVKE